MTDTADGCVFCEIIEGKRLDTEIIGRGLEWIALVPIKPVTPGHLLFIPKMHFEGFSDSPMEAAVLVAAAGIYARQQPEMYREANIIVSQGKSATQTVPHCHLHLVPRAPDDGLIIPWGKPSHEHKPKSVPLSGSHP